MTALLFPRPRRRTRPGMTLLELLVVLVAVGILAALAFVGYSAAMERAYRAAMLNDLRNFATARGIYAAEQESYPATVEATGNHNYTEHVFELDYWNGGPFWSLIVGHRKTETVCMVHEYEGEGYWIGCERQNRLEFDATPGEQYLQMNFDAQAGIVNVGITPENIQRVAWSYGNGQTSAGGSEHQTPSHTYEQPGKYRVQLVVTPKKGRMRVGYRDVQVGGGNVDGAPPVAAFDVYEVVDGTTALAPASSPEAPSFLSRFAAYAAETLTAALSDPVLGDTVYLPVGAKIEMDATPSYDPAGRKIVSYKWTLAGFGSRLDGKVVRHSLSTEPSITLTVTNDLGLTHSRTRYVKFVNPGAPYADFTWSPEPADVGQNVRFDASPSQHTGMRRFARYHWLFANGDTAVGIKPQKKFAAAGPQVVTLTVTDDRGKTATKTDTVQVVDRGLKIDWDFCAGYGRSQIPDAMGGGALTLRQMRKFEMPWSAYWEAGPPAHLRFHSYTPDQRQIWGETSISQTAGQWTWVFLQNHAGTGGSLQTLMRLNHTTNDRLTLLRNAGNIQFTNASTSYSFGTWPTGWSTIMVQGRNVNTTEQDVEVFVNGVSRGTQRTGRRTPPTGPLEAFIHRTVNSAGDTVPFYSFEGEAGGMKLFTGPMSAADIAAEHAALMTKVATGCAPTTEAWVQARFKVTPGVPEAGLEATFDASESRSNRSTIVRYEWDFGTWGTKTTTTPTVRHTFTTPGRYGVRLKVLDADGREGEVIQDVTVYAAAVLKAHWNACASYGQDRLVDIANGQHFPLRQDATQPIPWERYWRGGPPVHFLSDSTSAEQRQAWPSGTLSGTSRTWTMFFLQNMKQEATNRYLFQTTNTAGAGTQFTVWRRSTGTLEVMDQNASTGFGAWPTGWNVIAVQVRENMPGTNSGQAAEVFVNGVSRGIDPSVNLTVPSGATQLLMNLQNNPSVYPVLAGKLGSVRWYEGSLPVERVAELSAEMLRESTEGCANVNNLTTEARFTYSPTEPAAGEAVRFDASASRVAGGTVASYAWDFGDWTSASTVEPRLDHTFLSPGTYGVRLIVTNSAGRADTVSQSVVVHPKASLLGVWSPCANYRQASWQDSQGGPAIALKLAWSGDLPRTPVTDLYTREDPVGVISGYHDGTVYNSYNNTVTAIESRVRGEMYMPRRTNASWTLIWLHNRKNDGGTSQQTLLSLHSAALRYAAIWHERPSGGSILSFYNNGSHHRYGPLPTGWHTQAFRFQEVPGTKQTLEVFVNGESRGVQQPNAPVLTLGDTIQLWGRRDGTNQIFSEHFVGTLGEMRVYEGTLSGAEIRQIHEEMMASKCAFPPNQSPSASFTYSPTSPVASSPISFDARGSTDADGTIAGYHWNFGNGITRTGITPSHTYAEAGDYTVRLTVVDNAGARSESTQTVRVGANTSTLVPRFGYTPAEPAVKQYATFDASISVGASTYAWLFEKGNSDGTDRVLSPSSTYRSVTQAWSTAGTYAATLTIHNAAGDSAKATQYVTVGVGTGNPVAVIEYDPAQPLQGDTVLFSGTKSYATVGQIVSYAWEFPGGGTATSPFVQAVFQGEGAQEVKLTVTDSQGKKHTTSQTVQVGKKQIHTSQPPVAVMSASPTPASTGQAVFFDGRQSSDPEGRPLRYSWDFGDGSPLGEGSTASHAYAAAGKYLARLTVTDDKGGQDTDTMSIAIGTSPAYVTQIIPKDSYKVWQEGTGCEPAVVSLRAYVTLDGVEQPSAPVRWTLVSGPGILSVSSGSWVAASEPVTVTMTGSGLIEVHAQARSGERGVAYIRSEKQTSTSGCVAPPKAFVTCPGEAHAGGSFTCTLSGQDVAGEVLTPSWGSWTKEFWAKGVVGDTATACGYVTNSKGVRSTDACASARSVNAAPTAKVSCPSSVASGSTYTCTAKGSDPDGHDTSLTTDWGGWSATFTAGAAGTEETRCIRVTDPHGASGPGCSEPVKVEPEICKDQKANNFGGPAPCTFDSPPLITRSAPVTVSAGCWAGNPGHYRWELAYSVSVTDPQGYPLTYEWSVSSTSAGVIFGPSSGQTTTSFSQIVYNIYASAQYFNVTFKATSTSPRGTKLTSSFTDVLSIQEGASCKG